MMTSEALWVRRGKALGLFDVSFHDQTRFENNHFFWRNRDFLAGARVAAEAATTGFDFKYAKISEFYGLSFGEILGDFVESGLYDTLYINLLDAGFVRNF
jgi:hypothetical protein